MNFSEIFWPSTLLKGQSSAPFTFVPLSLHHLSRFRAHHDAKLFFCHLHVSAYFFGSQSTPPTENPFACLRPPFLLDTPFRPFHLLIFCHFQFPPQYLLPSFLHSPCQSNLNPSPWKPDKSGAIVVWQTDIYLPESRQQLSDTYSYLPQDHDANNKHQTTVSCTRIDHLKHPTWSQASNMIMIMLQPHTSGFYCIPKIYKQDCP